jgi:hypothetical protein
MRVHLLGIQLHKKLHILLSLGNVEFPTDPTSNMISFHPDFFHVVSSVREIVENVFPDIAINYNNHKWLCERGIQAHRNKSVNYIRK